MSQVVSSRLLVVDDDQNLLHFLTELFKKDYRVVAVNSGEKGLAAAKDEVFPVVIIDLSMPGMSGLETLFHLRQLSKRQKVIVLTGHSSELRAIECINQGAFRYAKKPCPSEKLHEYVREALAEFHADVESLSSGIVSANQLRQFDLTKRESQVAFEVSQGLNNAAIAEQLGISVRCVEKHLESIYRKFDVSNRTRLTAKLHEWVRCLTR